ncbi:MAG: WecB/TagA/CpsF family glycosyltransferase, partial [Clostridium sp.]
MKNINILGYKVFSSTMEECIDEIFKMKKVHVVSGNPEVLFQGLNDLDLKRNFLSEDTVIIPDGVGTQISARILKTPVKEKIAGIECMDSIIRRCAMEGKSVYFLGTKEEIISKGVSNIKGKYPNLIVAGYRNGYFKSEETEEILKEIKESKPYALFVALGCPRQEKFIIENMDKLDTSVFMGVGGSLDVLSGTLKRAPKWMISIGFEWAYRVVKEPWRIKRLG